MNVLLTGATGTLGRHTAEALHASGHDVRLQSRRARGDEPHNDWVAADLATGTGLDAAVAGIDTVVHLASDPRRPKPVDVDGTRRLVQAAEAAGVRHFVYVSIVGVDRIPLGYYRAKREAETIVEAAGVPYSILRATQFHAFLDTLMGGVSRVPLLLPLPTSFPVQPVAAEDVAARLAGAVADGAGGRLPDVGGPEVLTVAQAAESWKRARGVRKPVLPVPLRGAVAAGFRSGHHTAPSSAQGTIRWADWLRR